MSLAQCKQNVQATHGKLQRIPSDVGPWMDADQICGPTGPQSFPMNGYTVSDGYCMNGGNIYGYTVKRGGETFAHNLCTSPMPKVTQLYSKMAW